MSRRDTVGPVPIGEPDRPIVVTVGTRAALVARDDLPFDVEEITEALIEGAGLLGIDGGAQSMGEELASLRLHPSAKRAYEKAGILPPPRQPPDWPKIVYFSLGILVILAGVYRGMLKLRRDRTSNLIGRRILGISLEASEPDSVHKLAEIRRTELPDRARRRWWRLGELDQSRWRYLHDLITDRIALAKENLSRALAEEIRGIARDESQDAIARDKHLRILEERVWMCFQEEELDASHQGMLLDIIHDGLDRARQV